MAPLPKRKYASARQGERRSHLALKSANLTDCPNCHVPRLAHHACKKCGYYKGVQVLTVGKAEK